jgi:signal transduction histidine kinase
VRLRARLIIIISLPAVLAVGIHGIIRVWQEEAQVRREERESLALTAAAAQIAVENALRNPRSPDMGRLLAAIVQEHASVDRIRLFDRGLALAAASDVPLHGRSGEVEGALEIVQLASATDRRVRAVIVDILARLGLLCALIIIPTALALQRQVIRPLSRLTEGIRALGRDRSSPPLPVDRRDELGEVAQAFNDMAQRLVAETEHSLDLEHRLRRSATVAVAGKLAASLAHEVGTPLNIISGRAEFLLKSMPDTDPRREDLEGIVSQIERISRIISSLLDSVRPQGPKLEPIEPAALIEQLFPLLRHTARQRDVTLVRDVAANLSPIQADPAQLQQVLINLVINALDATPPGGRIVISIAAGDRGEHPGIVLRVADTGCGIPPPLLPRVFDAFLTTKPPGGGTGLGLAICRDLVRAHGGEITVESTIALGSTFTVWLPLVPALHE